ncbi:MAG: nucleoside triphosphate pyrophosphohydrolase [Dehalococcoidia bacterium]|nr:nucleoside triphosphate pyrophosphohydrolase [Dehalococcoidia bacterium]
MNRPGNEFGRADLGRFSTFRKIIQRLRGPGGCPWDRRQTHASLKPYLVEESYEVLETLEDQNLPALCEELGDLWLQIMLHSQIAEEAGEFTLEDVLRGINSKLIHRHPHVFGNRRVKDAAEVSANWQELKGEEKEGSHSLLSGVPRGMPALAYSQSIQRRAASVGFDWEKVDDILKKLVEEVDELKNALSREEKEREFGDILFTLVNLGRRMDMDVESALRQANRRFTERFKYIEEECRRKGVDLKTLTLVEMDRLWDEAKETESGGGRKGLPGNHSCAQ